VEDEEAGGDDKDKVEEEEEEGEGEEDEDEYDGEHKGKGGDRGRYEGGYGDRDAEEHKLTNN